MLWTGRKLRLALLHLQPRTMSENKPPESGSVPAHGSLPAVPPKEPPKNLEELIQKKAPDILEAIPVSERPKLAKVTIEETRISYRSGMLPEPDELAAYNAIIPNGADRIMRMAEAQSSHRIELERTVVISQQGQEKRGQIFGLIIALSFGGGGLYAALNGQPWFGGVITGTTLVSLVGIFVYTKQQVRKDLSDKKQGTMVPAAGSPKSPPQRDEKNRRKR